MLSFFPNGDWLMKRHLCNCSSCLIGSFNRCEDGDNLNQDPSIDEIIDEEFIETNDSDMHTYVEPNSFIAVYSSSKSLELFYIIHVIEKLIAEDDMIDLYGHIIPNGEHYLKGHYLEKVDQKKDKITYKKHKKVVFIHPYEIFCPVVQMNPEELYLPIEDYLYLADSM